MKPLNIFFYAPNPDRWMPYDRYPRRLVRELLYATGIRKRRPTGQRMVYQNLKKGLDRAGIPYRDNDYRYIRQHPDELMCVVGKPRLLDEFDWPNPILFGASLFAHPIEAPNFWERHPSVKKMLVPGEWMKEMFAQHYLPERVRYGPVSSVPYWDERCGMKFEDIDEFGEVFDTFWSRVNGRDFLPREYILEKLTLEYFARNYCYIAEKSLDAHTPA